MTAIDWKSRIIFGRRLGRPEPPQWLLDSHEKFHEALSAPGYPCYFGAQAEKHGHFYYSYASRSDLAHLPSTLRTFTEIMRVHARTRTNLVVFLKRERSCRNHQAYRSMFWEILQYLTDRDPQRAANVAAVSPDDPLWEFSFAGSLFFVVGAAPSYRLRRSRNLGEGLVMLFQPREVFLDPRTALPIGPQVRASIRNRLAAWDEISAHPDLGVYGDRHNREWRQYFLSDDDQPEQGECPLNAVRNHSQASQANSGASVTDDVRNAASPARQHRVRP
jgi:FPC/CPF motif-containing protein YcgG